MTAPTTLERRSGQPMLTVADLLAFLHTQDPDMQLVMSKDAEGNGYSPLAGVETAMYLAETTWAGDIYPTPEEIASEDYLSEEDGAPDGAVRVLVLGPVN